MPLSVTQVGLLRSLHFLPADRHHSHHKGLNVSSRAHPRITRTTNSHRVELQRLRKKRIAAIKRKMQATADDQGRITRMKTKLNREILSNRVMIAVLNRFDLLANLLSFMGISHSKLGKLGDCLDCREHVSEFQSMLVEIKTATSVEKDAAAEEEDAERKEKYAATDAAEDNDPAAEEKDADADAAEDDDPPAEEKDAAAKDNDPAVEEKDADADAAEDNDPADAAAAADDSFLWSDSAMHDLCRSDIDGRCGS
ncbi:hypothetical protein EJB05_02920 [Eragrostis curvula]|uniref:Uncharacterized protein n=1 Tax=Eragrostis curvula TaxID=38414 RepID=A0A5J9WTP9_9POAL|nr:hypothetical protein EJB05_02920 [Eragrostis curvula]